jgi:virginiamycin B lyase
MRTSGWLTLLAIAVLAACASHGGSAPSLPVTPEFLGAATASKITYYNVGSGTNDYEGFTTYAGANGIIYYDVVAQPTCNPGGFCAAAQGNVGELNPSTKAFTEVTLYGEPLGIAQTSDGAVWSAENTQIKGGSNGILARLSPFSAAGLTEIPLPAVASGPSPQPRALAIGSDANLWFTDQQGSRIGKISPAGPYTTAAMTMYAVPSGPVGTPQLPAHPWGIASGSDGNLWFADRLNGVIYKSTTSGVMTGYITPEQVKLGSSNTSAPSYLALGSNGRQYFTESTSPGKFDSISTSGTFAKIALPSGSVPYLNASKGATIAFSDIQNSAIGIYNVTTHKIVELPTRTLVQPTLKAPDGVAVQSANSIWFSCFGPPPTGKPICLGNLSLTSVWSVFPSTTITVKTGSTNAQLIGLGETGDSGPFTASSSNTAIATVAISSVAGDDHNFVITGVAAGTVTVTITDAASRAVPITVTVK